MGRGDGEYLNPGAISDTLRCCICTEIYEDPVFCSDRPCQHVFCRLCIEQALRLQPRCPTCRAGMQPQNLRPHLLVRSLLDELLVRCGSGCGWTGRCDARASHESSCPVKRLRLAESLLAERDAQLEQLLAQKDVELETLRTSLRAKDAKIARLEAQSTAVAAPAALEGEQILDGTTTFERELQDHAAGIIQQYAALIHTWHVQKRVADSTPNAADPVERKSLYDTALLGFEAFLYRIPTAGEEEVFVHLLTKSIEAQRALRHWRPEDEGRILYFLAVVLRSQGKCLMLSEDVGPSGARRCQLLPIDTDRQKRYIDCLLQAYIVDEAVRGLQHNKGLLVKTASTLAFVWAHWQLDVDDKFRLNEVLNLLSVLVYNTVQVLEGGKAAGGDITGFLAPVEYFVLLLHAIQWPKSWKMPLIRRAKLLFPSLRPFADRVATDIGGLRQHVKNHQFTQQEARLLSEWQRRRPEPSEQFFQQHKECFAWVMLFEERIAAEYVLAICPDMLGVDPGSPSTR